MNNIFMEISIFSKTKNEKGGTVLEFRKSL